MAETQEVAQKGFDYKVHHYDPKSRKLSKVNPYRLIIKNGKRIMIRGGKCYAADGSVIGKAEAEKMLMQYSPKPALSKAVVESQKAVSEANTARDEALSIAELLKQKMVSLEEKERLLDEKLKAVGLDLLKNEKTPAELLAEKLESERLESAKVETAKVEAAKLETAKLEATKLETAKLYGEKMEAAKLKAGQGQGAGSGSQDKKEEVKK